MVGKGRRKIEMKLIENDKARAVCFSKRRSGLFKKAKELSILCGAKVGAVAFSLSGKPMVFNAPALDSFLDPQSQFCSELPPLQEAADDWESAFWKAMTGNASPCWWKNVDLQSMGMKELLRFENALAAYREKRIREEMMGFDALQVEQMAACGEKREVEKMDFCGLQMMQQSPTGIESPSLAPIETELDSSVLEQLELQYMYS